MDYEPKSPVANVVVKTIQLILLPFMIVYFAVAIWIMVWFAFTRAGNGRAG